MPNFYNDVESLSLFPTQQALEDYRLMLLRKTEHQVNFIKKHIIPRLGGPAFDVTELGCGNGRLLVALSKAGLLDSGDGYDISASRINFASLWAEENWELSFGCKDILDLTRLPKSTDLCICITGCLNYFNYSELDHVLSVASGARFGLFELYKPPKQNKFWFELPPEDPFQYYLNEYTPLIEENFGPHGDALVHSKVFIGRDGSIDKRQEVLYYYSMGEFLDLCLGVGFKQTHWAVEDSEKLVVLVE